MTGSAKLRRRLFSTTAGERGSVALEWAIVAPSILLIMAVLALAGRVAIASGSVEQAANDAARAASMARTATQAVNDARAAATMSLNDQGIDCISSNVDVNTAGFAVPVGQHATVSVTITCDIKVMDLPIPGLTSRTAIKTGVSPLDTYRQR